MWSTTAQSCCANTWRNACRAGEPGDPGKGLPAGRTALRCGTPPIISGGNSPFEGLLALELFRADQLPCGIDLFPGVPQQDATHPAFPEVVQDTFAVRLRPVLDDLHVACEFTHGFVAEIKEVGVEVREVPVLFLGACHVPSCSCAHDIGVIFVLNASADAERRAVEVRDVAGSIDVRV